MWEGAIRPTIVLPPQHHPHGIAVAVRESHHPETMRPPLLECQQPDAATLAVGIQVAAVAVSFRLVGSCTAGCSLTA